MTNDKNELLRNSIARNLGAVLSLPSAGLLRHHKSRFLSEADNGFWMESVASEVPLIEELIATQKAAGVAFKNGTQKVVFTTPILQRDSQYRINADTTVEAVLLQMPAEIKAVQRRNAYRVTVPADSELSVRVWRISEKAYLGDRPMAAQEVITVVRDLSIGGMGVLLKGRNGQLPVISVEDRLRIQFVYQDITLLMEGRLRTPNPTPDPDTLRAGIQFKALENDVQGRQTLAQLTKIVGELQRAEIRRHRLGLTA